MPFGKNSCLTALRHFPRWHQLACISSTEPAQYSFNSVIWHFSAENICMKFLFQLEGWLYNSHPPRIGSPATAGSATFRGLQCRAQQSPKFIPLVTYLLLQYNCKKCYTLCPTTDENKKNKELIYKPIYVGLRSTTLRSSGYGLLEGFRRST